MISMDGKAQFKKRKEAAQTLEAQSVILMSTGLFDSAVTVLCAALIIDPSRVSAIHKIGECLEASGAEADAVSCFRGTLPDSIALKYFNSEYIDKKVLPVRKCVDVTYHPGFMEERIALTSPERNNAPARYQQFRYKETYAREAFCTIADEGSIWFDNINTLALDKNGSIIDQQVKGNVYSAYHAIKASTVRQLNGTACFLDGRSSSIYYHWMLDILPKLGVLQGAEIQLKDIDYFIVAAKSRFQLETLLACGVNEKQIVFAKNTFLYRATRMIVPNLKNDQGEKIYHGLGVGLSSRIPKFLQQTFAPDQSGSVLRSDKSVRVYISRSTRGSRNIADESVLIEQLNHRGFKTVEFEHLTVREQAALMARADVVIGVHGAGFTNLSFCRPGTQVIEIFGDYVVPCYWALCAVAKLNYAQYMASGVADNTVADNPAQRVTQLRDREIKIDVNDFVEYLDAKLGTSVAA